MKTFLMFFCLAVAVVGFACFISAKTDAQAFGGFGMVCAAGIVMVIVGRELDKPQKPERSSMRDQYYGDEHMIIKDDKHIITHLPSKAHEIYNNNDLWERQN